MRCCIILLTVFSWVLTISAQENSREKTAKGSYTYEIPKNMSYEQACQVALIKAQNDAIAEAFGLVITDDRNIFISNINGKSSTNFISATRGSVRGVWLADKKPAQYEKFLQNNRDWVKVTVEGKVREIVSAGIDFDVAPIRYVADKELATDVFKNNDNFFLYFKSPVDGYLTVFLFDKADDGKVDELVVTCAEGKSEEYNQLFIIFSPNKYAKKLSTIGQKQLTDELVIPSSLEYKDFNKWLMKCQQKDEEMEVRRIPIKITHN